MLMATNQDFDNLITRVNTATNTLEVVVGNISQAGGAITDQVLEAKSASAEAKQEATNATNQANIASAQATISSNKASEAIQEAQKAQQAKEQAQQIVEEAKTLAPFQEAPKNGSVYGRKDGVWTLVESSEGGKGTVVSVNGITPDVQGDVTLPIPEQVNSDWNATQGLAQILNKPTLFSGDYNDLQNKPMVFSGNYDDLVGAPTVPNRTSQLYNDSTFLTDAPFDGESYVRNSGEWVVAQTGGGGGGGSTDTSQGFGIEEEYTYYDGQEMTNWVSSNPFVIADLSKVVSAYYEDISGKDFFTGSDNLRSLPSGRYKFYESTFPLAPLNGKTGYIDVAKIPTELFGGKQDRIATAYIMNTTGEVRESYTLNTTNFSWHKVEPPVAEQAKKVINKRTGTAFEEWIGSQSQYDAITSKDPNTRYWITEV